MGTKPCLVFAGEAFDEDKEHRRLKSLLTGRMLDDLARHYIKYKLYRQILTYHISVSSAMQRPRWATSLFF